MLKKLAVFGLVSFMGVVFGTPVGTLNIAGALTSSLGQLDFLPPMGPPTGDFFIIQPSSGSFSGAAGTKGTIKDLNQEDQPVNMGGFSLADFMTFDTLPVTLELTFIKTGAYPVDACDDAPAIGQVCTPADSQFNLTNIPDGLGGLNTIATMAVSGSATDGKGTSNFVGVFSTQIIGPYQNLLDVIEAGGSVTTSYSASFSFVPIPEPSTTAMLLSGCVALLGAGAIRRRQRLN